MASVVTEAVMGAGTWALDLDAADGPWRSRLDPLVADAGYATLAVLPSRPPWAPVARQVTNLDTIYANAVYLGMLTHRDDSTLRGEGIASWMGRPNGIGPRVYAAGGVSTSTFMSMLQLVRTCVGDDIFAPPPQSLRVAAPVNTTWWAAAGGGLMLLERRMARTYRQDLEEFVRWMGARYTQAFAASWSPMQLVEWRVVPWSTSAAVPGAFGLHVDERRQLYAPWRIGGVATAPPQWVVSDDTDAASPYTITAEIETGTHLDDYATRWWTNPAQQGTAQFGDVAGSTNYRHWADLGPVVMVGSGDETVPTTPPAVPANAVAGRRWQEAQTRGVTMSARCAGRAVPWRVPVGADVAVDTVALRDLSGATAPRWIDGRQILPVERRIDQATWGIPTGAGVYLVLSANGAPSGDGFSIVDLSDAFVPDDSPAQVTLGDPRKRPDYLS